MMIELRPGLLTNKGGELMLLAAIAELGSEHALAVEHWIAPYARRARLGLYQKLWLRRAGPLAGLTGLLTPTRVRRMYGLVSERDIAAVLDLSGFAYSDQFGRARVEAAARSVVRWKRQGKRVVLLPQAFGPFADPRIRSAAATLLAGADLVFVRDSVSGAHIRELGVDGLRVRMAPDFTITLPPVAPSMPLPERFACIVPNEKMLTHAPPDTAKAYLSFLETAVGEVRRHHLEPVIVLHESADQGIAGRLQARLGEPLRQISDEDPLVLKGVIAAARLVIGSRFHALVGGLSQGVPSIAAGWSHKYVALFDEFGCPELVLRPEDYGQGLARAIERLVDGPERDRLTAMLQERVRAQAGEVSAMWSDVRKALAA